jgi:D-serine deaminase-like pyridoxal phosphate-dependent protein
MNQKTKIEDYIDFLSFGRTISELDTSVQDVDTDILDRNLRTWQERCDAARSANRPHIKTHKLAGLAKFQLPLSAKGITVQKLGEAEVMAATGISDILLTFNFLGGRGCVA